MSNVFKTCSLHSAYHTGCIDCQHDMHEEISILKADNARMREALEWLVNLSCGYSSANEYTDAVILGMQALKGGE